MIVYFERIVPPGPLPGEPADVLALDRTNESLKRENAWLKAQIRNNGSGNSGVQEDN